ncbi:MAG TPA: hypothetical protein DEB39_00645 [Planctomycetaceae bacterium]|nr:hypothetical protein [Planctomycetaceae bacterium]
MIYTDDGTLVEMVRNGHREAFDEIDRRYRGKIRRFLIRETVSRDHAEDLTQQTLFRAFRDIRNMPATEELGAWLYRIAWRFLEKETNSSGFEAISSIDCIHSPETDPAEVLERRDENTDLWILAGKILTPDEYTAVWLKYVDDRKIDQIARTMSRSRISVRVLLFRARRKLLQSYKK